MDRCVRSIALAFVGALALGVGAARGADAPKESNEQPSESESAASPVDAELELDIEADGDGEEENAVTAFLDDGTLPELPEFSELPQAAEMTRLEFRDWIREEIDPPGPFLHEDRVDLRAPVSVANAMIPPPEGWLVDYRFLTSQASGWIQGGNPLSDAELETSWGARMDGAGDWATERRIYDRHVVDLTYAMQRGAAIYLRPHFESETLRQRSFGSGTSGRTRSYGQSGISEIAGGALLDVYDDPQNIVVIQLGAVAPLDVVSGYKSSWALDAPAGTGPEEWFTPEWRVQPAVTYKHYGKWWSGGAQWLSDWELSGSPTGEIDQSSHLNVWFSYLLDRHKALAFSVRGEAVWREVGHESLIPPSLALSDPRLQDGQTFNMGYGLMFQLPMGGRLNLEIAHLLYQHSSDVQIQDQFALAASYSKTF